MSEFTARRKGGKSREHMFQYWLYKSASVEGLYLEYLRYYCFKREVSGESERRV